MRIAERPELVEVSAQTRAALNRVIDATGGAVAILSGRPLAQVDGFLTPLILPGAGSHGVERRDARGAFTAVTKGGHELEDATARLQDYAVHHDLLLEQKRGGSAIHFRAAPHLETDIRAMADDLAAQNDGLRVIHGHMVAELSLAGSDKGSALVAFMDEPPFAGRIPVAIGDDTTDEDAFRAAQQRGGIGIRIGGAETCAKARFADFDAFHPWFATIAESGIMRLERP